MGYQINSVWTQMRKDDIEELNAIIDNKYNVELEIGRKLNLLKRFKEKLDKEIKDFNLDIVLKFMRDNNWEWAKTLTQYEIPNEQMIKDHIQEDFNHAMYHIIELKENNYSVFSGGIVFEAGLIGNNPWVSIYFDISHFVND